MGDEVNYDQGAYIDSGAQLRNLEEKQRIIKDRLLLIGENLVEHKEQTSEELLELKKDVEELKTTVARMNRLIETFSSELSKFAKKEDLEMLQKQAKMFQPLEFVRKSELETLKKK